MRWQTHARAALGVLLLAMAGGVVWYVMRQAPSAESPAPSPRTDVEAETELGAGETVRTDATGALVYRVKYERVLIYPAATNRMRLVGVSGTLARGGQPMEFRADEADIKLKAGAMGDPAKFDEMHMRGSVLLKSGPGAEPLHLETSDALYNELTGIVTTDKAAKIKRGNMSGSGTGATFDRNRSVVWLLNDARVSIATEGQGTLDVTATRAGLAQAEHYMRFEENVRIARGGRVIETDAAVANLTPDGKRITSLELTGNSRVTGGGAGDVPDMRANDITITYNDETGTLERAVLMGAARIDLPEGGGRSLAAGHIDMGFAADGTTLTVLDATDAVELKIPAEGDQPAREVRAPRLEARGAEPKGLERAQFSGGVEFREQAPAQGKREAVDRVGRSETLVLGLDGGFDKIKNADFSGDVRFRDRDITGEAPEATYGVDTKRIVLRGGAGNARVIQEDGTIDAKEIDLTLDPRKMLAKGNPVKSTLKPGARKDRKEPRPSILEDDQPVHVTSRTLDYDGVADRAVYTGDARLWQGDTTIQAETIVLDDKTGNLEARKKVRGTFLIREDPAPGQKPEPAKPTIATAEELIYDEARRQATFRQNARMDGPDGNITAGRIEIFLKEDGNTLERAEAYDTVKASLGNNRVATGERLTYNATTRIYTMTGKPLVVRQQIEDKGAAGKIRCQRTDGASLTLNRLTDSITVRGTDGAPSRTVPEPCSAKLPVP